MQIIHLLQQPHIDGALGHVPFRTAARTRTFLSKPLRDALPVKNCFASRTSNSFGYDIPQLGKANHTRVCFFFLFLILANFVVIFSPTMRRAELHIDGVITSIHRLRNKGGVVKDKKRKKKKEKKKKRIRLQSKNRHSVLTIPGL
jgi:hypothetical protein